MNIELSMYNFIYVIIMLVGAGIIAFMSKNPKGVSKVEYLISFIIPTWSALAYIAMTLGQGSIYISNQITFYARYIDWIVTTPLLLISLSLVSMYYDTKKDYSLIAGLIYVDIVMILSGCIADLSTGYARFIWYFIGVICLFVSLYIIWVPLKKLSKQQGAKIEKIYSTLVSYLTLFWIGYPLFWILGPSGLKIFSQQIDTIAFVVLPAFSKVGFGLLLLTKLRKLQD